MSRPPPPPPPSPRPQPPPPARIELYGHADCCLCDTARSVLERLRRELGFELVERDIAADEALHRAYFERVPVVVVDGEELFDYAVDEDALRRHLARPAAAPPDAVEAGPTGTRRRPGPAWR